MRKYTVIPVGEKDYLVKASGLGYLRICIHIVHIMNFSANAGRFGSIEEALSAIERFIWQEGFRKKNAIRANRRDEKCFCVPPWPSRK